MTYSANIQGRLCWIRDSRWRGAEGEEANKKTKVEGPEETMVEGGEPNPREEELVLREKEDRPKLREDEKPRPERVTKSAGGRRG